MKAHDPSTRDAGVVRVRRVSAGVTLGTLAATAFSAIALQGTLPEPTAKTGGTATTDAGDTRQQARTAKLRPVLQPPVRDEAPQTTTVVRRAPAATAPRPAAPAAPPQPAAAVAPPAAESSGS